MSVFRSNARPAHSVMAQDAFLARRASIAAIHRDRIARLNAEQASALQTAIREANAADAASRTVPAMLERLTHANGTQDGPANAFDRVRLEDAIRAAVLRERRINRPLTDADTLRQESRLR